MPITAVQPQFLSLVDVLDTHTACVSVLNLIARPLLSFHFGIYCCMPMKY
eukprot:m.67902 g.67902  ORF g.67902 m.67902 type:complete len:50 (+) comp13655_c0_seq1:752-901(+)